VTKVHKASIPDIPLPKMSGIGAGLAGDIGGFDVMPDQEQMTLFCGGQAIGNDFVGTFYDLKRDRRGNPTAMDEGKFVAELTRFVASGFKSSKLARYYRPPKKLYATTFMIPTVRSQIAPAAFDESDTIGYVWMVHYKKAVGVSGRYQDPFLGYG